MKNIEYGTAEYNAVKEEILSTCGVVPTENFDVKVAIQKRIDYLKKFLKNSGRKAFVLGISGGVDSTTTGKLCQIACNQLHTEGYDAQFIAMRLPSGVQLDEVDAQAALSFINPDKILTVNIGEAATNLSIQGIEELQRVGGVITPEQADFAKGNIKARIRMTSQYQIAAIFEGVVIGTDHAAEFCMAFFTRWGDQSCDLTVLNGLNKRQVRLLAKELGAPEKLWGKVATADLEELRPQKTDSEGFGFEYDYLDDYLEGKEIPKDVEIKLVNHFNNTRFKREPITEFKG